MQPGSRIAHFEVLAPIGAGGMGEVYRARDTRLGRDVAIKVLRAEVAGDPERVKRFEKEARTVASLSHPNILALFDVGSHEGQPYLVTELLEGQTLAERIRSGDLTVAKAVELGTQVAHGLAAAHEHGVVHRDLKPGNVFVTKDGVVKILDFGLARLTHVESGEWDPATASTETGLTGHGAILGTVGYMSPEQVRALPADHRSDIFAFGCVLYEMLSGHRAFQRESAVETAAAILNEEPPDIAGAMKGVPPRLEAIVARCLEKAPEDRFQSARDLAHDLGTILQDTRPAKHGSAPATGKRWRMIVFASAAVAVLTVVAVLVFKVAAPVREAPPTKPPKIVVLPFENLGSPEDAYFAAGMAEEITSRLANVQGLGVISRTTAIQYNRTGKTVKEIGEDLGVDYLLEGSVRWDHGPGRESRVRITPQLIRVADDTHVWADRYERVLADVFAIQSQVAESAVRAMGIALRPNERTVLKAVSTSDLEAYDLYLRGLKLRSGGQDRKHVEGALQMYQAAVDRDPRFADGLAALARTRLEMYWLYYDRSPEQLVKAKESAERAVGLRPDLAQNHNALGFHFYLGLRDYSRALESFTEALRIQPTNSEALEGTGYVLRRQGEWENSAVRLARALESDPKNSNLLYNGAASLVLARRYLEADRALGLAVALSQDWGDSYGRRAWLQVQWQGDVEEAEAVLDEAGRGVGVSDDVGILAHVALGVRLARRDYQGALRQLEAEERSAIQNQFMYSPLPLLRGQVQRLADQQDLARRSFDAARLELEQKVREAPDDDRLHGSLGIAYAGLDRRDDAVREARLGCDLMPASKDSWRALYRLEDLALVYTMIGMNSDAVATLADLLARSGWWTSNVLRLDPRWDPLRSDPRFQALLTKYEVKE